MKSIITTHKNPLLEDITLLEAERPEEYAGFVYMWECVPEGKFYIGSHKGEVTDDYRGSGRRFRALFEHYGITQFRRVVLEYVEDEDHLRFREQAWIIRFRAVVSPNFLNIKNAAR
jgi:hypothetical protein